MTTDKNFLEVKNILEHILDLSRRISRHSPPMKPFLRFSKKADRIYRHNTKSYKCLFWDFDDTLQKILLGIALTIATPMEISCLCIERWKTNLEDLYQRRKRQLKELMENKDKPQYNYTPRDEFIFSKIKPGGRLLYVGCGSGVECLGWAKRGYDVVGIDTDRKLVEIGNEWAKYLELPFRSIVMDAQDIGFARGSFDGFLLEFYGFQPSLAQALELQKGLANVLNVNGKGFIVANRKKYASFWYKMSNQYPAAMVRWLASQSQLDFYFSKTDECEEKFMCGLYVKSHTVDSLSLELSCTFDVLECAYEKYDPRYVLSVVKRKSFLSSTLSLVEEECRKVWPKREQLNVLSITDIISRVENVCDILETHEKSIVQFFNSDGGFTGEGVLLAMETELPRFIELLENILEVLPTVGKD